MKKEENTTQKAKKYNLDELKNKKIYIQNPDADIQVDIKEKIKKQVQSTKVYLSDRFRQSIGISKLNTNEALGFLVMYFVPASAKIKISDFEKEIEEKGLEDFVDLIEVNPKHVVGQLISDFIKMPAFRRQLPYTFSAKKYTDYYEYVNDEGKTVKGRLVGWMIHTYAIDLYPELTQNQEETDTEVQVINNHKAKKEMLLLLNVEIDHEGLQLRYNKGLDRKLEDMGLDPHIAHEAFRRFEQQFLEQYTERLNHYSHTDIRNMIYYAITSDPAVIRIEQKGGVYFVPVQFQRKIAALAHIMDKYKIGNLTWAPIMNDDDSKKNISRIIMADMTKKLLTIKNAILDLQEKAKQIGSDTNKLLLIQKKINEHIAKYAEILAVAESYETQLNLSLNYLQTIKEQVLDLLTSNASTIQHKIEETNPSLKMGTDDSEKPILPKKTRKRRKKKERQEIKFNEEKINALLESLKL